MRNDPIVLGRFNYYTIKPDLYHVVFTPFTGCLACIVARNLPREEAMALITDLNGGIDDTRKALAGIEEKDDDEM